MATINRENIGVLNDRITVLVAGEDYLPNFEKTLKQYSKTASIPGFRKGMVPAGLIRKMHGQTLFTQEVIKTVETELTQYLQAEKLDLFGQPIPDDLDQVKVDMNNPTEYAFKFEIGMKPEVELTPLNNEFKFTRYKVTVEDKDIDEEVVRLQKKAGERREKEEVSAEEDILSLGFSPSDADGQVAEGDEPRKEQIIVSYFSVDARGQLMGKKPGDTMVLKLSQAFEQKELDWMIRDWKLDPETAPRQSYLIRIEKIEEIIPMELGEDLFNQVYPGSGILTTEEFRARIRKDDEGYWIQEAGKRLDTDIFETLVHGTPIELPVAYLKKSMKLNGEKPRTDEEVEQGYSQFDHEMRWNLISGKIIRDQAIDVSPEELQENFRDRLRSYFGPSADQVVGSRMEEFVTNMMKDEKAVDETYRTLLTNKLFKWLREQAEIEEKEVTAEEFSKLPHNHHHHEHA